MRSCLRGLCLAALVTFEIQAQDPAAQGKELVEKRCSGCHTLDKEKEGPRLRGVYGRRSGSVATFSYSDALTNARIVWDADTLERWLADPDSVAPGNDMSFRVMKADERAHIIAYLKQLSEAAKAPGTRTSDGRQ